MSIEEAQLILNVKKGDSMEKILEVRRLFHIRCPILAEYHLFSD